VKSLPFLLLALSLTAHAAGFKKVAEGSGHTLLLQDDGVVLGFGESVYGSLATPAGTFLRKPTPIPLPRPAIDIATAKWSGFALLDDGTVYSWGSDEDFVLGRPLPGANRPAVKGSPIPAPIAGLPKVTRLTGSMHTVAAITESGDLWMWGIVVNNRRSAPIRADLPRRIEGLPPLAAFSMNERTYPGVTHKLALGRDGSVWAWGYNSMGQLGDSTTEPSDVPKRINIPPVASLAAGGNNSVAVLTDGTVRVWGGNDSSTMGNGANVQGSVNSTPVPLAGITGAVAAAAGTGHVAVLLKNGTIRIWGHDGWGQTGVGTSGDYKMRPVAPRLTGITAIHLAPNRTYLITTGGRLWFCGPGNYRLPPPMKVDAHLPIDITALW
jgi:alpha-tubulin suppressor-like RCC1 family protein